MPKPAHRRRAFRPLPESLEGRKLLAARFTGVDIDGDHYVLRLIGPGSMKVLDASGLPIDSATPTLINQITLDGTSTFSSRLVGRVTKAAGGDGKVFFQNMDVIGVSGNQTGPGTNGMRAIVMPKFWMGDTSPAVAKTSTTIGAMTVSDGVQLLKFGGIDTTAFFGTQDSQRLTQDGRNDLFEIDLGLPAIRGTRIIIDKSITSGQPATTDSSGAQQGPFQNGVLFRVLGRINRFQANAIEGDASIPSTQFPKADGSQGGTIVESSQSINVRGSSVNSSVNSAIGLVKVGSGATNFSVLTVPNVSSGFSSGPANVPINQLFVGGETTNVFAFAPGGARTLYFGRGMDTVTVQAQQINAIKANRGMIGSIVGANGPINSVRVGGDAINSVVDSGLQQDFAAIYTAGVQGSQAPIPLATPGGRITAFVAGNVTDTVFVASVEPNPSLNSNNAPVYGPDALVLHKGSIRAKVEGAIDNANNTLVDPSVADQAFFADHVKLYKAPVTPPDVPQPPYSRGSKIHATRARTTTGTSGTGTTGTSGTGTTGAGTTPGTTS